MIPETENASNASSWPPVVVVAVAAVALGGSVLYFSPPLESQRPSNPSTVLETSWHPQFPLARLWQDPLHVVYEHWRNTGEEQWKAVPFITDAREVFNDLAGADGTDRSADDDRRVPHADNDRRVLRLLVMLSGMPYSDDRERRRRQRHAVVSALTGSGFVPRGGTRMQYFRAPPFREIPDAAVSSSNDHDFGILDEYFARNSPNHTTLVGYEMYEPNVEPGWGSWPLVEVFWLNTEDFSRNPLHRVSALVAALDLRRLDSNDTAPVGEATTVLLGPPSSGVLKAMFDEDPNEMPRMVRDFLKRVAETDAWRRSVPDGPRGLFQEVVWVGERHFNFKSLESSARKARTGMRIFSHQATIPVEWLVCRPDDAGCPAERAGLRQPPGVESFHSSIADDGQVLEAVLKELVNRGACNGSERPTVVIVSEQDTVYGRLIGDLAEHAAKQLGGGEGCEFQIIQHGYLRGVDGEMPPRRRQPPIRLAGRENDRRNEPAQEDTGVAADAQAVRSLPEGDFEQPFGAAQLDYVRRLSERLPRDGSDATLVAIGVLGTDLYDKLLILQALRESHPGVVFFTTDMDARLLDPAVNQWTRNLIVGSAYGLSPPESASDTSQNSYLVADTFRDSYQVALFVAVQEALDLQHGITHEAKLFEISSRAAFFQLGSRVSDRNKREVAVMLTPLAALAFFAVVMFWRQREKAARVRRQLYGFVAIFASAAAAWLYTFVQRLPNTEPGPLFEGVSTVPMVMLQITTIVFAVAVICFAHGRMRHTLSHVAGRLVGKEPERGLRAFWTAVQKWSSRNDGTRPAGDWRRWFSAFVSVCKRDVDGSAKDNKMKAAKLWSKVLHDSGCWPRFARIGTGLLVGLALRHVYFSSVRTDQPMLGQAETTPGWMTNVLAVMLFLAISYCRDTVLVWRAFIRVLGRFDVIGGENDGKVDMEKRTERARWSMDLLVYCTNVIGPVVVLPLILMVLLMLARSTLFDGWNWTTPLIVFHVGLSVYVLAIAIAFQREARQARASVLDRLLEVKLGAVNDHSRKEIDAFVEYIRSRRDGAFVPWIQHPIMQTLTLPLGSYALITLLERWIGR